MKRRSPVGQRVRDFVAEKTWGSISKGRYAHRSPLGLGRRRLRAEALEQRRLLSLTTAYVDDTLYDVNGGALESGDSVVFAPGEVGETSGLVYGTDAFDSVQQAIDAVDEGGNVVLATGQYAEPLYIAKDVTLTGVTGVASDVVVENVVEESYLITIDAGDVVVEDLSLSLGPSTPGVLCLGAESALTLSGIEAIGGPAVEFYGESLVVTDSYFEGNLAWAVLMNAGTGTIDGNQFVNCDEGVELSNMYGSEVAARITNNTFIGTPYTMGAGVVVVGSRAMIEGNTFAQCAIASVWVAWDGVADLGQLEGGVDITGLGISSGGNDFSSVLPNPEGCYAILASFGTNVVSGPQGLPLDLPAMGNTWFSDNPLEIEEVIWHDPDSSELPFVDYAVLGDLTLATVNNEVGEETVTTLSGSFTNDPQAHSVEIDWGDGGSETVALTTGEWTFDVDHVYEGGVGGGGTPVVDDATMAVEENSLAGTLVGTVVATGGGGGGGSYTINVTVTDSQGGVLGGSTTVEGGTGGPLTYSIIGGSGQAAFAIDPNTGEVTVVDGTLLDFETITSYTLEVEVSNGTATDTATITVELVNRPSVTGAVFVDVNEDGVYDANEPTIDNVTITLLDQAGSPVLDAQGNPVVATTDGGFYLFEDLVAGTYQLHEVQPTGVDDGGELLGSLGGSIAANDTMQVTLTTTDAHDYIFGEIGQQVDAGDTATTGFWHSRRGRNLMIQGGAALAQWLTNSFGNVFGDELVGADGMDVYRFFQTELIRHRSILSLLTARVDTEFMALALATYFTNSNLAGDIGASAGFVVTDTGIGTNVINVRGSGEAFGVANGTSMTIMQMLQTTNAMTDPDDHLSGYANVYDLNGDGRINLSEAYLRLLAHNTFRTIIRQG